MEVHHILERIPGAKWKVQRWGWRSRGIGGPPAPTMTRAGKLRPGKYKVKMRTMFSHAAHGLAMPEVTLTVK